MLRLHDGIFKQAGRFFMPLCLAAAFYASTAMKAQAQVPPPNDNLTNAQGIINANGAALGTNLFATAEQKEPAPFTANPAQASIWFQWTAPYSTTEDFTTSGSTETNGNSLNTVMAVYVLKNPLKPLALNNLALIANNAAYSPATGEVTSRVHVPVALGATYFIQVDGALNTNTGLNDTGIINLSWTPSVQVGDIGFSSAVFTAGANDGLFLAPNPGGELSPTSRPPEGGTGARVTVVRSSGNGACEVELLMTNGFYTNVYETNFSGTNITTVYFDGSNNVIGITNTIFAYVASQNFVMNANGGPPYAFLPADSVYTISQTNTGTSTNSPLTAGNIVTNYPTMAGLGLQNFFTNFTTGANSTNNLITTSPTTNVSVSNVFSQTFLSLVVTPSAIAGVDYPTAPIPVTFSNFQMSQDIYIPLSQDVGPDFPDVMGNFVYDGINPMILLTLTNAVTDPGDDADLAPPVIGNGGAELDVLSFMIDPNNSGNKMHTNNSTDGTVAAVGQSPNNLVADGMVSVNWEMSKFRVDKNVGTATVYVYLTGNPAAGSSYTVNYTVDFSQPLGALNWNGWPTTPGADYATPSNGLTDFDFSAPTSGWTGNGGTVTIGPFPTPNPYAAIAIPINNNPTTEFESDIYLQITGVSGGPPSAYVGTVSTANLTINYDPIPYGSPAFNEHPPGGSVDVDYNPDNLTGTFSGYPVSNPFPGANQAVQAVAMQGSNAIIGGAFTAFDSVPVYGVTRLLRTGLPDFTFNPVKDGGVNYLGVVNAIAIDPFGRIVIGGLFNSYNGVGAGNIARLLRNGTLDTNFVTGLGFSGAVYALAIDAGGNIVAGGDFTSFNSTNCNHIARLLSNGALDSGFAPNTGNGQANFGTDQDVLALGMDGAGNIILGGEFNFVNGANLNYLARLLPNGKLDPQFSPEIGPDNTVNALAMETNNEILIGGSFQNYNLVSRNSIALVGINGALDTGFTPGSGADNTVYAITVQPDGNILIGGQFRNYNGSRRLGIARLLPSGWLDTSFLDTAYNQFAGLPTPFFNSPSPTAFAFGFDPGNSNIVVGGAFSQVGGGATRIDVHPRLNVASLIGSGTTNTDRGGIGNDPGNITLLTDQYTVDDIAGSLFVTLNRINGSLGPATVTLGTNTLPPGPGAASSADFGLGIPASTYDEIYANNAPPQIQSQVGGSDYGWKQSDAIWGLNYNYQPVQFSDGNELPLDLTIQNDPKALQNLYASISLLNLNSPLNLGGVPIPTYPGLGLPGATLEIVNDNFPPGLFGFSVSNFTTVNTSNKAVVSVLRTNGSADFVEIQYFTKNGTAISNVSGTLNDYANSSGTLTFGPGVTSNGFTVTIENHSSAQPTKFFNVFLANASLNTGNGLTPFTNAFDTNVPPLVWSNATVTIIDGNFTPGHLCFVPGSFTVLKPGVASVGVERIGGALGQLTVQCGTRDGTAVNGANYIGTTNTLAWGNQDVSVKTILIPTLQDNKVDGPLTVNISLFNATNVGSINNDSFILNSAVGPITDTLTILDSDSYGTLNFAAPASFGLPNFNIAQNAGQALITIVRANGATGTDTVGYATVPDASPSPGFQGAVVGRDYGLTTGTLTFAPGVVSQTFAVPVYYNPSETVVTNRVLTLELTNGSANISAQFPKYATLTILDPKLILNQAGGVDTTTLNGTGFNGFVDSLTLQPDGNLLAGGDFTFFNQYPFGFVGRLTSSAQYDIKFLFNQAGANGAVQQVLSSTTNTVQTNDGPIVIAGSFSTVDGVNRNGIARMNLDGSVDETFNPGSGADSTVFAVAETLLPTALPGQTNLAYYIAGNFANFDGIPTGAIARLNGSSNSPGYPGTVDGSFNVGQGGVPSINGAIHALAVQGDNNVIAGGDFTFVNSVAHNHLFRINPAGTVDQSFNTSTGAATGDSVRAIALQPDGKILIGGSFKTVTDSNGTYGLNYLARLNSDGTVDQNFQVGAGGNNSVLALAVDSQQRILVGGEFTTFSGVTRSGITRLNPDGTVDPTINFGSGADGGFVDTIVIQGNDEIDVGGGFSTFEGYSENNFVRLYGGTINSAYGAVQFSEPIFGVLQNGTNAVITLQRTGGEAPITVVFATSNLTAQAGRDYQTVTTNIAFPLGETFETILIPIINSEQPGSNLTVGLYLSNPANAVDPSNSVIGVQASAELIITNVITTVAYSAPTYVDSANAPGGYAQIPIFRTGLTNLTSQVTVFTEAGGTAVPYTNYIPVTNSLTFNPGITVLYFDVPLINATNVFTDLTVDLGMIAPTNAILGNPSGAVLTIANDFTGPGVLAFSLTNYTVNQTAGGAVITVIRTNGASGPVSVTLTTSNGTAVPGINYQPVTRTLNFADSETNESTTIPVLPQSSSGPDTTVILTLSNPQPSPAQGGPSIASSQAVLTIQNLVQNFSFGQATSTTSQSNILNLTVLRGGPASNSASVSYHTFSPQGATETAGLAVPNADYVPASGTLTFGSNQPRMIPITILQNNIAYGPLTFQVILDNPSPAGVVVASPSTNTVTIFSDLTAFQLTTNLYVVAENGTNLAITVNRLNTTNPAASVQFSASDGTNQTALLNAHAGIDYVGTNGTLSFLPGQTSNTFIVNLLNPNILQGNKSFNLSIFHPLVTTNPAYLEAPFNALVTITNVLTSNTMIIPTPYTVTAFASSAFISWTTPILSTAQVAYGLTPSLGTLTSLSGPSTNHTFLLTGLQRNATYYFGAVSWFDEPPYPRPYATNGSFSTSDSLILNTIDAYYSGVWLGGPSSVGNYFGPNYNEAATTTAYPTSSATYDPLILTPGLYNVYAWYPTNSNFSTNAQVYLFGGTNTVFVSLNETAHQTINGQSWQPLATNLYFAGGTNGSVIFYNNTGEAGKYVVANAMMWTYVDSQDFPSVVSGQIPAWWSAFYTNSAAANTNYADYVFGLSPNDPASKLQFGASAPSNNVVAAFFSPYLGGRTYRLEASSDLSAPQWTTLTNLPSISTAPFTNAIGTFTNGTGYGVFTVTQPNGSHLFYRLAAQLGTNY
ncbi:MAG TPA: Calx-beta domain-containing protein [Verrucomicrobiae bacterium]|jgi:uncharacterized delta-60 repeat protein